MPDVGPYLDRICDVFKDYRTVPAITEHHVRALVRDILVEATDHAAAIREQDFEALKDANATLEVENQELRDRIER